MLKEKLSNKKNSSTKKLATKDAVSESKKKQRATINAIKKEQLFDGIFAQSPLGLAIIDTPHGTIWQANKNFLTIFGISNKVSQTIDWTKNIHPKDKPIFIKKLNNLKSSSSSSTQLTARFIHNNKSTVWASLSFVKLNKSTQ